MTLNISAVPAKELSKQHLECWGRLQQADSQFDSPYFRPEFTQAVADVRDGIEVAVIESSDGPVGFLPYRRERQNLARPAAGEFCDFQGMVSKAGIEIDAREVLRACGLKAWRFKNLPVTQTSFSPYLLMTKESHVIDLSGGYEAFRKRREGLGSKRIQRSASKGRKMGREIGDVRLEWQSDSREAFDTVIRLKRQQYERLQVPDVLGPPWTIAMLERLWELDDPALRGQLSVLYSGDSIAAAHFGLFSHGVLHWWLPVYNNDLRKYSPGSTMMVYLAEQCEDLGLTKVDLGAGPEEYKASFKTGETLMAEGSVNTLPLAHKLHSGWVRCREFVRRTPLAGVAQRTYFATRGWFGRRST